MTFFAPPTPLVLHSDLSPDQCARRLSQATDPLEVSLLSLSGYRGKKDFLEETAGRRFAIRKRIYTRNVDLIFAGELTALKRGTQIAGAFDLGTVSKVFIFITLIGAAFIITPAIYHATREEFGIKMGALALCAYPFVAMFVLRILPVLALGQRRDITDFLVETLEANEDPTPFKCTR